MSLWPTAGTVEVLGERYGRVDLSGRSGSRIGLASTAVEAVMRPDLFDPAQLIVTARHGALEPWWHEYTEAERVQRPGRRAGGRARAGRSAAHQPFETLSAGERRRVSIARALMPDPERLLVLDEPMANLDLGAREGLIRDLSRAWQGPNRSRQETRPRDPPSRGHPGRGSKHALVLRGRPGGQGRPDRRRARR